MELFNLKDHNEKVSFAEAVVKGIGKDQGLFFPDHIVPLNNVDELLDMPLVERSQKILRHLIGDEVPELEAIIADAFTFKAPIVKADENVQHLTILTATSGDTGAAVAAAFYEQKGIDVVVLYPKGKISDLQEKLIATLGKNIKAVQVEGIFDECQDMVKTAFDDVEFKNTVGLNSANSINISRLLAQVSYYFEAVSQLPKDKRNSVVFSIPCGNFGNITAGLIAKALGLKARFVISCNANDTVPRYLKSGNWEPHQTVATLSNAMDISRPNNWPRVEALVKMMGWSLKDFDFGSMSDAQTEKTMQALYKKTGYILEPHAAIAYQTLADNLKEGETGIFLGTAHPAKFKGEVDRILNIDLPLPEALASRVAMDSLAKTLPADYDTLKKYVLEALELN